MTKIQQAGSSSGKFEVVPVAKESVGSIWEVVLPWINAALEHGHGELLAEDIYSAIMQDEMHMLVVVEDYTPVFVLVFEVIQFPRKKAFHIEAMGGVAHLEEFGDMVMEMLFDAARKLEVDFITGHTWPAVERLVKKHGFGHWYTVIGQEVSYENHH
jgi:hypothetical protein